MPRIRLTKSAIDGLPALPKDTVYWDASLPGFGVNQIWDHDADAPIPVLAKAAGLF